MSPLTKIFVVLHVVLSMLLAAAVVTFVNTVDDYRQASDQTRAELVSAQTRAAEATSRLEAEQRRSAEAIEAVQRQLEQARQQVNRLQQEIADRDTRLAQLNSQLALASTDVTRLTEALNAAQRTQGVLQQQVAELRQIADQRQSQNVQLNTTVTDLQNRLDVTERERRFLAEQLTEAQQQVQRQAAALRDAGIAPAQIAAAGLRAGAPPIQGVVRATRTIAGVPYATISVGANDDVVRGMEFRVIAPNGDFLGTLIIDSVEQTESVGRLMGPRVADIGPGSQVRTQM